MKLKKEATDRDSDTRISKDNYLQFSKRGVSELIGYLLLVVFTVIIAAIVFTWLRSYVPDDSLQCPEGTSVFIKESSLNEATNELTLVLKNNGRFDLAGFFIRASNNAEAETATIDLSNYSSSGGQVFGNSIVYVLGENQMSPGDTKTTTFSIPVSEIGTPYSVDIIPVRYQTEDNRERFVSCSTAKTESKVGAPGEENPVLCGNSQIDAGEACDGGTGCTECSCNSGYSSTSPVSVNCQVTPLTCGNSQIDSGEICDGGTGCTECSCDLGYEPTTPTSTSCQLICGNGELDSGETCDGGANCIAPGQPNQCSCPSGYLADGSLGCTLAGNGICDTGETCSSSPTDCEGEQAQCSVGQLCQSGSCEWEGGVYGEDEYCIDLGFANGGNCVANNGQCNSQGGSNQNTQPGAETYCPGSAILCCFS